MGERKFDIDMAIWRLGDRDAFLKDTPEKLALENEFRCKIEELWEIALSSSILNEEERKLIELHYHKRHTIKEVAKILFGSDGKKEQNRCSQMKKRAIKKLRDNLPSVILDYFTN